MIRAVEASTLYTPINNDRLWDNTQNCHAISKFMTCLYLGGTSTCNNFRPQRHDPRWPLRSLAFTVDRWPGTFCRRFRRNTLLTLTYRSNIFMNRFDIHVWSWYITSLSTPLKEDYLFGYPTRCCYQAGVLPIRVVYSLLGWCIIYMYMY